LASSAVTIVSTCAKTVGEASTSRRLLAGSGVMLSTPLRFRPGFCAVNTFWIKVAMASASPFTSKMRSCFSRDIASPPPSSFSMTDSASCKSVRVPETISEFDFSSAVTVTRLIGSPRAS
jgi:hypothetical protein